MPIKTKQIKNKPVKKKPVKNKPNKKKPAKKKNLKGGSGLVGFADFLGPQLKSTGWLSQTASNFGNLPFTPDWGKIASIVASQSLRHAGY
jgi:hypothetical protein